MLGLFCALMSCVYHVFSFSVVAVGPAPRLDMKWIKYILRVSCLVWLVFLLMSLNEKADVHSRTVAEFKFETFKKIRTDSMGTWHRLGLLRSETEKFLDDSPHVRDNTWNMVKLLVFWIAMEIVFLLAGRRNSAQP